MHWTHFTDICKIDKGRWNEYKGERALVLVDQLPFFFDSLLILDWGLFYLVSNRFVQRYHLRVLGSWPPVYENFYIHNVGFPSYTVGYQSSYRSLPFLRIGLSATDCRVKFCPVSRVLVVYVFCRLVTSLNCSSPTPSLQTVTGLRILSIRVIVFWPNTWWESEWAIDSWLSPQCQCHHDRGRWSWLTWTAFTPFFL